MRLWRPVLALLMAPGILMSAESPQQPARAAGLAAHPRIILDTPTLTRLAHDAKTGTPAWQALKARCDEYLQGQVSWPDGEDYPDTGIGEGYQGDEYYPAVLNLGLCYQIARQLHLPAAGAYGARGADLLTKMSAPDGPHAVNPLRDDGYGIRFYGAGMALGYDWFYDALSPDLRHRLVAALGRWLSTYAKSGFEHEFPQGNYFAGYYLASAFAGLAVQGDDPQGNAWWKDWIQRIHGQMVQPYYAANLTGGGWPEGWNYGPLATVNMILPALAAKTALGLDLVHKSSAPYLFPEGAARFLLYFTWPNLHTLEDSDLQYNGSNPSSADPWLFSEIAYLDAALGDSFAPAFHRFARAVRTAQHADTSDWDLSANFLFWDDSAPERDYSTLPLSYYAHGIEMAAVRSSWKPTAVWAAFKAGPYTNNPNNGEQYYDEGSLAIMNGDKQFLVNPPGALQRYPAGADDGPDYGDKFYDCLFSSDGKCELFNVFYAGNRLQNDRLRSDGARTAITRDVDGVTYVALRGEHLEDMYGNSDKKPVTSWTRDVIYLRPSLFVIYDRTAVADPSQDQWMDFNFAGQPRQTAKAGGVTRYDVGSGANYAGTVQVVLPSGHSDTVADVFDSHKVYRLEVHAPKGQAGERWVTVIDAAHSAATAATAEPLTIKGASMLGLLLHGAGKSYAVLGGAGAAGSLVHGSFTYTLPTTSTLNVVTDLPANTAYTVSSSTAGGHVTISVRPGAGMRTNTAGILSFTTGPSGQVQQ